MILRCSECNAAHSPAIPRWRCDCGGYLRLEGTSLFRPGQADRAAGLWRYAEAFGLDNPARAVTLGEGCTPLVPGELAGRPVYFKLDYLCPTGSFKDRGSAVMISRLLEWGIHHIVEDSSGNAGAAVAAYAAAAGIRADIYIPGRCSMGKAAQIALYGAHVVKIDGTREDTTAAALEAARHSFYASHNWSPYFVAGLKTVAFEIAGQLGWKTPDWVFAPVGGGSLILGLQQGFKELLEAGRVRTLPRLVAVQAEQCAPVCHAWSANLDVVKAVRKGETAAEGISIAEPVKGKDILKAIRDSRGLARGVPDTAIWKTLGTLGRKGIFVEPTSAAAPAAAEAMTAEGLLRRDETVVIVLTGTGLKATDKIVQYLGSMES
jgi:threonine synthase